jgi:hypothetical protein
MRLSLAAAVAALVLLLPPLGTAPAQAKISTSVSKRAEHKHFKLFVRKKGKHYHFVHTYKSHKEAQKAAHKYHKRGYKTKIRAN